MAEFRRWYMALLRYSWIAEHGRAYTLRAAAKFPLRALREARHAVALYGAGIARAYGVRPLRQLADQYVMRLRYGILPTTYYQLRLFLPERRAQAWAYFGSFEHVVVMMELLRRLPAEPRAILDDKQRFDEWCTAHGLPAAVTVARIRASGVLPASPLLPPADLFSKPVGGIRGRGVCLWRHERTDGMDRWYDDRGVHARGPVDARELVATLAAGPEECGYLLQRRLVNHPGAADLTTGGLATARIMTIRDGAGRITVVGAVYKMPTGGAASDHFLHGGIVAPVDPETGRLGPALRNDPHLAVATTAVHPDTGAPIVDRVLPLWSEARALAERAHDLLPALRIVGWDVALSADGPLLIEGNDMPGVTVVQMASGIPFGCTAYVRTILEQLATLGPGRSIAPQERRELGNPTSR